MDEIRTFEVRGIVRDGALIIVDGNAVGITSIPLVRIAYPDDFSDRVAAREWVEWAQMQSNGTESLRQTDPWFRWADNVRSGIKVRKQYPASGARRQAAAFESWHAAARDMIKRTEVKRSRDNASKWKRWSWTVERNHRRKHAAA